MKTEHTPEDEFNSIIDSIETRCMASDGPVTPTLKEATEEEFSRLWELVNEISGRRKLLARKSLRGTINDEEVKEYLRGEGLDPEQIAHEGSVFVKTIQEKIKLTSRVSDLEKVNAELIEKLEKGIEEISHLKFEYKDKGHGVRWMKEAYELIQKSKPQ